MVNGSLTEEFYLHRSLSLNIKFRFVLNETLKEWVFDYLCSSLNSESSFELLLEINLSVEE